MSINHTILSLLNRIFPPEQPTESELLAYTRETNPTEKRVVYALEHKCWIHGTDLREIEPGLWECSTCHQKPPQSCQNEQEVPQTYTAYTQDVQPKYAAFQTLQHHDEHMLDVKVKAMHSDAPLTMLLEAMPKSTAFHQTHLQNMEVEDAPWLNSKSKPIPQEIPIVKKEDLDDTLNVRAILQLKHGA